MAIQADADGLASVPVIGLAEREALRIIAFSSEQITMAAGEVLARRGGALSGGYVVLSGSLVLEGDAPARSAPLILRPGALFGESALVIEAPSPGDLVARERSEVLLVQRKLFRRVLTEFPRTAAAVRSAFESRLRDTMSALRGVGDRLSAIDLEAATYRE